MEYKCITNKPPANAWLRPFGSVMILMLAVCVLLLSFSHTDPIKLADAAGSIRAAFGLSAQPARRSSAGQAQGMEFQQAVLLVRIKEKLDALLKNKSNVQALEVLTVEEGFLVRLSHGAIFAGEPLALRSEVKPVLKQLAALLADLPNVIRIEGHTSDQTPVSGGLLVNNWVLSAAEAATLANFLTTEGGLDPMRLVVRGMGPYAPIDSNATTEGRNRNRRIDLLMTREIRSGLANQPISPQSTPSDGSASGKS